MGNLMFTIVPIAVSAGFLLCLIMLAVMVVQGLLAWSRNNHAPRLTVSAQVVTKRTSVSHRRRQAHGSHHGGMGAGHMTTSTRYFVTFQMDSGERMELPVSGPEYGMLAEGDRGSLTFQGTRYLSFQRS